MEERRGMLPGSDSEEIKEGRDPGHEIYAQIQINRTEHDSRRWIDRAKLRRAPQVKWDLDYKAAYVVGRPTAAGNSSGGRIFFE